MVKYKTDVDKLRAENSDLSTSFSEEQRKAINLAAELSNNSRLQCISIKTGAVEAGAQGAQLRTHFFAKWQFS